MINPNGHRLDKILFKLFDKVVSGSDVYTYNGSVWLIFPDSMRWAAEYSKTGTLWFNYYFFNDVMDLFALNLDENSGAIQRWFEVRYLNVVGGDHNGIDRSIMVNCEQPFDGERISKVGVKRAEYLFGGHYHIVSEVVGHGIKCSGEKYNEI